MRESTHANRTRSRAFWSVAIALASIAFVGGAYTVFEALALPSAPDLTTADADAVAAYLGDPRGWCGLSLTERKQWLLDLAAAREDGPAREALTDALRRMAKSEKQIFVDGFLEVVKPELLADARAFSRLPVREQDGFLREKLEDYNALATALRGGDKGTTSLTASFGSALPGGKADWSRVLMEKTTAAERAEIMPYIGRLTVLSARLKAQATLKAQAKSSASQPAEEP
jgi:hypothetical protein